MPPSYLPPKEDAWLPCRFPRPRHRVLSDWGICRPAMAPSRCTHQGVQPGFASPTPFPHITYSQQCAVRVSALARFCNRVTPLFLLARSASLDCSSGGRVSYDAALLSLLCSALPCAQRGRTPLQDRSVWPAGGAVACCACTPKGLNSRSCPLMGCRQQAWVQGRAGAFRGPSPRLVTGISCLSASVSNLPI